MKVKILSQQAKLPTIAYESDAGFDVYSPTGEVIYKNSHTQIKLGISIAIEPDEVAIMSERSGMAINLGVHSIGNIIDSGYRGEISIILFNSSDKDIYFKVGDKIGQIVVCKLGARKITEVDNLDETERGDSAHYSSGK